MKNLALALMGLSFLFFIGCAHVHKVETASSTTSVPKGYVANIGGLEVKEGDILEVKKPFCRNFSPAKMGHLSNCPLKLVGKAEVLKILGDDSAIVGPKDGLVMDDKMFVEKKN